LAASLKIRTGLVELRTSSGTVYASPSFWERVYLVWTFRNFHCLPKEVLSLHQRQLIDRLCRVAVRQRSIADSDIIGIVENVRLAPSAATASNLIEMVSSTVEYNMPRAVAAGGTSTRWDPPADHSDGARLIPSTTPVAEISPPKKHARPRNQDGAYPEPRVRATTGRLAWIWVGVAAVAAAGVLFRSQIRSRVMPAADVSVTAPKVEVPSAANTPVRPVTEVQVIDPATALPTKPSAGTVEDVPSRPPLAAAKPEEKPGNPRIARAPVAPEIAKDDSALEPRLQITLPPVSGFRYPVTPSSSLTGKVSLRAVIGSDGSVRKVDVLSGNRALAAAAVQAVRHWRYPAPALDGHAVEAETNIAINFVGDDAVSVSFPASR
jgi:TonB family protein